MPIYSANYELTSKRQRNIRIGQLIAGAAVVYPFLVYAIVWSHYSMAHSELSRGADAFLLLLAPPICLGCAFAMVIFILDGRGKTRAAGIAGALVGIIVNVLFLLANGTV